MATFCRKTFIFLLLFILNSLFIIASDQCADPRGDCLFSHLDVREFLHQLLELWHYYAILLLAGGPGKWHPVYGNYGLSWKALVIVALINILFLTFAWRKLIKTFNSTTKEERHELQKTLRAQMSRVQQLEEQIKTIERDLDVLQTEQAQMELEAKVLRQKLDEREMQNAAQQTAESLACSEREAELKELLESHKQKILEMEQDHKKAEDLLKMQMEHHKRQAEENWTNTLAAEHALAVERKETADLRQKVIEVTTQLTEIQQSVSVPPPEKDGKTSGKSGKSALDGDGKSYEEKQVEEKSDKELEGGASKTACSNVDELIANAIKEEQSKHEETLKASELKSQQLEGKIKMLKEDRDAQKNDMLKLQIQISSLQRKLSNLSELCEKKDQIIQQKSAQVDSERREKHLKVKEVLRSHKHKIQEIETERQKMAHSYISEIEALKKKQNSVKSGPPGRPLTANRKEITTPQNKVEVSTPPTEQGSQEKLYLEKLQAEEKKTQELIEQIRALQQDRDAVKDEKSQLEDQAAALQAKLQNMSEQCQLKEQALQQKVAQMECESHGHKLKIKELVMSNEEKVQNIESEHQKLELSYKAELVQAAEELNVCLEKLRAEEKKTQDLAEKIKMLEQDRDAVKNEKSQLEQLTATLQRELQNINEQCQQKEQDLQKKVAQMESERHYCELKIKELVMANEQKVQNIESEHQKTELSYTAEIKSLEKKWHENLMRACASDHALTVSKKEVADLRKQLDEVKAELADLQRPQSEPTPGCSFWETTPGEKSGSVTATNLPHKSSHELDQLPHAVEEERNLYLKKLRDEKKKTQELEGKILTEVQLRHALEMEKSHFEHEAAALQEELDKMIDLSHRQEQTLQQKVMQVQAALLEKEEEIQRVLQAQSLRIREMEEEREKMQGAYLAQIENEVRQAKENLMKAESSEEALAAERKMTATLQNQLDEVKAELAKFQQAVSEPVPDPYGQEMCPLGADVETMESTFADTSDYEVPQNWSFMQMEDSPPSRRQRSYCVTSVSSIKRKGAKFLKVFKRL